VEGSGRRGESLVFDNRKDDNTRQKTSKHWWAEDPLVSRDPVIGHSEAISTLGHWNCSPSEKGTKSTASVYLCWRNSSSGVCHIVRGIVYSLSLEMAAECIADTTTRSSPVPLPLPFLKVAIGVIVCKIWGFHGSDYEECGLLGYKIPVRTSQETH
jgi:hypothetical protein